jgi:hypothetical protein
MLFIKRPKVRSYETGLFFKDKEFRGILNSGNYWFFDLLNKIRMDVASQRDPWLAHKDLDVIIKSEALKDKALVLDLKDYERALVWIDGRFDRVLTPGQYSYWTKSGKVRLFTIDARETVLDIGGQEIMTSDKVSLRVNALLTYRVVDARKAVETVSDIGQALYREAQLAFR